MTKCSILALLILTTLGAGRLSSHAVNVTLAWNPSTDPTVASYNLYYGVSSHVYTNIVAAGLAATVTVSNLTAGLTYYFAGTTVDVNGLESSFSSEVVYQIPQSLCAIVLTNLSQTYDSTPKTASVVTTPPGLAVTLTYNGQSTPPSTAGSFQVIATVTDPNYVGSSTNTLTISKAGATVQLADLNQIFDGTPKIASATTLPAGLAVLLTYNDLPTPPTMAGNYQINASVADPNYAGSTTAMLTIEKANATVQLANLNQTYDGAPKPAIVLTQPLALPVAFTYNGLSDAPTNAGTYLVSATIIDATDYSGGATNILTVAKANARVELDGLTQSFDGNPKTAVISTTPSNLNVIVTYNGLPRAPIAPGTYDLVATVTDANYMGIATNIFVIKNTNGPTIIISWPLSASEVSLSQSTDLVTWIPLATIFAPSNSFLVLEEPGSHFFRATRSGPEGTNRLPLRLRFTPPPLQMVQPEQPWVRSNRSVW